MTLIDQFWPILTNFYKKGLINKLRRGDLIGFQWIRSDFQFKVNYNLQSNLVILNFQGWFNRLSRGQCYHCPNCRNQTHKKYGWADNFSVKKLCLMALILAMVTLSPESRSRKNYEIFSSSVFCVYHKRKLEFFHES